MSSHYSSRSLDGFFNEAATYKPLSKRSEQRLAVRCVKGDQKAMEILVKHNLLFAVRQAKKQVTDTIELDDLIQESIIGMYVAAERFKPVGVRFITYATWYIKCGLQRYKSERSGPIRWPYNSIEAVSYIKRFRAMGGSDGATPGEVRKTPGFNVKMLTDFRQETARWSMMPTLSLNAPVSLHGENGSTHIEMLAVGGGTIDDLGMAKSRRAIDMAMGCLTEREAYCINRYFLDMPPKGGRAIRIDDTTYDDISEELGLTRERIRQVINEAMKKMRGRKHGDILRKALEELAE